MAGNHAGAAVCESMGDDAWLSDRDWGYGAEIDGGGGK
jgi:hypothetical protein